MAIANAITGQSLRSRAMRTRAACSNGARNDISTGSIRRLRSSIAESIFSLSWRFFRATAGACRLARQCGKVVYIHMMFHVTLEKAEDGWIVAECPALPGCVSQGADEKEAVETSPRPSAPGCGLRIRRLWQVYPNIRDLNRSWWPFRQ